MLLSFGTTLRDGVLLPKVLDSFLFLFIARCQTPLLHIILVLYQSPLLSIAYNSQHTYCTLYVPFLTVSVKCFHQLFEFLAKNRKFWNHQIVNLIAVALTPSH